MLSLTSYFQKDRKHRFPMVTLILVGLICAFQYYLFMGLSKPYVWYLCVCDNDYVKQGQVWRLVTSVLPHDGWKHLAFDILYIIFVGSLTEYFFSRRQLLTVWCLSHITGAVMFIAFVRSPSYGFGSSSATHGLFAYVATRLLLELHRMSGRLLCGGILASLYYMAISTILSGFTVTMIESDGWAHFGGVAMGTILAFYGHIQYRRANKAIDVDQEPIGD